MMDEDIEHKINLFCDILQVDYNPKEESIMEFINRITDPVEEITLFTSSEIKGFLITELLPDEVKSSHRTARSRFITRVMETAPEEVENTVKKARYTREIVDRYLSNDYIDETGDKFDRYLHKHKDRWKKCALKLAKRYAHRIHFVISDQQFFDEMNEMLNAFSKVYLGGREQHNFLRKSLEKEIIKEISSAILPVFQSHLENQGFSIITKTVYDDNFVISGAKLPNITDVE